MKTQFIILVLAVVFLQMFSQTDAFLSTVWNAVKGIFGKRGVRNLDQFDHLFEPDMSDADMRYLKQLFR
uniref:CYLIP-Cer-1 n=1 Tax=Cercophonius squama TaxID=1330404 RepID=T1DEI3_9SCOR